MQFEAERAAVETLFQTEWAASAESAVPVAYENVAFEAVDEFVRLRVLNGEAMQASLGSNPVFRYMGLVDVLISIPIDKGRKRLNALANVVSGIFRNRQINAGDGGWITTRVPFLTVHGEVNGKYIGTVSIKFHRDEF